VVRSDNGKEKHQENEKEHGSPYTGDPTRQKQKAKCNLNEKASLQGDRQIPGQFRI
jgi:hypothetical protein